MSNKRNYFYATIVLRNPIDGTKFKKYRDIPKLKVDQFKRFAVQKFAGAWYINFYEAEKNPATKAHNFVKREYI